jgi:V/A-type H+-transporting ATPase subunit I
MMRLQAVVLAVDERAVIKGLGLSGAVHLTRTLAGPATAPLPPIEHTVEMAQYDRMRTRVHELSQSLGIPLLPRATIEIHSSLYMHEGATLGPLIEANLLSMEQQCTDLLEHCRSLMQRQKELIAVREQISCYRGLEIPLDGFDRFSFLHFITGSIPTQNLDSLKKEIGDNVALLPLSQQKGRQSLFAITTRQGQPDLETALQQACFQREILPVVEGATVDKLSEENRIEQEQLTMELDQLNGRIKIIAAEFTQPLSEIEGFVDMECRLLEASRKFPRTETAVLITGWIPGSDVTALEQQLGEITGGRHIIETVIPDDSEEEEIPVLLRHSRLLRPFEMLVSTYGLPNYRELEPTLFVALSYLVMFGMMFGDAGHGAVLAVCGLIALLVSKSEKIQDIGLLLLLAGSSSIISGVVYGSYFGIEVFKKYALWHDPIEGDPMSLMYGAIGIGIAMISLGLILNIINRFRRGDVIGAILDKFGLIGILFYWGVLALIMNGTAIRSRGLMGVSIVLFLVVPILGWSLKEPMEHLLRHKAGEQDETKGGLAGALMESCVGAFEALLSYLANTISFVRLAAYAMSHAALLFAAFMVAAEVRDVPFGGSLWSLLIIVLGNFVAIVLEGIIASVQALRLEYYEFFGKFFSGSGQPFEPFRLARNNKASPL